MQYNQTHFFEPDESKMEFVITAESHAIHTIAVSRSPYLKQDPWKVLYLRFSLFIVRIAELLLGAGLYATDVLGPLKALPAETLSLLTWLSKKGYIRSWRCNTIAPGQVQYAWFGITPNPVTTPEGKQLRQEGTLGNGIGETLAEATLIAIGEFIERYSIASAWWERRDLIKVSILNLKKSKKKFLDPRLLRMSENNNEDSPKRKMELKEDSQIGFVQGYEMFSRTSILIPASCAYMFYTTTNNEPFIRETNSNGAAAHKTLGEAEYRAACELIERDAFLQAWYHQKNVPKIETISIPEVLPECAKLIQNFIKHPHMSLAVLDVTSDIGIPTFCAMLRNSVDGRPALTLGMAADTRARIALKRALGEVASTMYNSAPQMSDVRRESLFQAALSGSISGLENRRALWSDEKMIETVDWLSGSKEELSCEQILTQYSTLDTKNSRTALKDALKNKKISLYIVQFTNELTKRAGLHVVRAISPELVPMFFNEKNQPLTLSRFAHAVDGSRVSLRKTPHPFI